MNTIKFIIFKLLKYDFLNQVLFKFLLITSLNRADKKKLKYYKKKFSVFDEPIKHRKLCLFNNLFGHKSTETISLYIFLLNIFKYSKFKPAIFSSFKFFDLIKISNIKTLPPLLSYSNFSFKKEFFFSSSNQIKRYKWKNISCGIFALSSTLKELKTEQFDINNIHHKSILKKNLLKSIAYTEAFYNFLKDNQVGSAIFSDPGYVGQGEMFQILTNKNIPCYQFFTSVDDNTIIFKKYLKKNQRDHFDKISNKNWNKLKRNLKKKNEIKKSLKNIKKLYEKNNWFPSVGTTRSENFYSKKEIFKKLKLDENKPIAVIFNHIFWDGTLFYGEDTFPSYRDWFIETIKIACKNKNINWIVKPHPANKVQNLRYGIDENTSEEEKIIKKYFGHIPKNVILLKNENKINSFSLYKILDYCLTIRGTPGIESAIFGSQTIICGSGRYENRGFSKYFKNRDNYLNYLGKLKKFPIKNTEAIRFATLYAENIFFKKPLKLESVSLTYKKNKTADMNLKIKFNSTKKFLENNDIKKLISWINSGKEEFYAD